MSLGRTRHPAPRSSAMRPLFKRRKRLLLLDDDPSMQRLVARILGNEGFRVDGVLTGSHAIAALERENYAGLLLDLMMPVKRGMTVIPSLRGKNPPMLKRSTLL